MKKYLYLLSLVGLLFSCSEENMVMYDQDKDALQFFVDDATNAASSLTRSFNFATVTYEDNDGIVKYKGDKDNDVAEFTLYMQLQGFPSPNERPYKLTVCSLDEGNAENKDMPEVEFEPYYSLAPNQLKDTITFKVKRLVDENGKYKRGVHKLGFKVETESGDSFFAPGAEEQNMLTLIISDKYEKPSDWDYRSLWFGDFSEEKYAFMVTNAQDVFSRNNNDMWNKTDDYNKELRKLLQEYNEQHPDDVKPFDFPVCTKMVWWDNYSYLLGDYWEDKLVWMKKVVDKYYESLDENSKLVYWNLIFRDKDSNNDYKIPRNTTQVTWWNSNVLGNWSVEKQEFTVRSIFSKQSDITNEVWVYANVMLRYELAEYEKNHGKMNFSFPVEGMPEWWSMRESNLGEYFVEKRDLVVKTMFDNNGGYGMELLTNPNQSLDSSMDDLRKAAEEYNLANPKERPIEFPVVAPGWWSSKESILGAYSAEKEAFMKTVTSKFGGYYSEWIAFEDWNLIYRYELAASSETYTFTFPEINSRPGYWDDYAYLGDYSDAKKAFVWMTLLPKYWGSIDTWVLSGATKPTPEPIYNTLVNAYKNGYDDFMKRYAAMKPQSFKFPDSYPTR